MFVLGLTGSIGMGKSTASAMFRCMGAPVYDSDASVHAVLRKGGSAVAPIDAAFPGVVADGAVDRDALGKRVFGDDAALRTLEGIVHPLIRRRQDDFLKRCSRARAPLVAGCVAMRHSESNAVRCEKVPHTRSN